MKTIIGLLLVLAGIAAGLYFGVYICFVGGIVQIIEGIKSDPVSSVAIAWGVAKIFFATLVGWGSALAGIVPGAALIKSC